jgi:hypothetical protein
MYRLILSFGQQRTQFRQRFGNDAALRLDALNYLIRGRGQSDILCKRRFIQSWGSRSSNWMINSANHATPLKVMASSRWTKEQLKLAFNLYCQLPFGKLHSRNAEIVELAKLIDRTPSAVAMKLVNFASLDPAITDTGRSGLGNASSLDREVWDEFHANWEQLALECALLNERLRENHATSASDITFDNSVDLNDYVGETRQVLTEQRIKQGFFRRAVLASYRGRCCMSGLSDARLLIASHIVPWSQDKINRLNPSNGLCLSALHDKAFDKGLITLSDDFKIIVSEELKRGKEAFIEAVILPLEGRLIDLPERFMPQPEFIVWHRNQLFLDNKERPWKRTSDSISLQRRGKLQALG